MTGAGGKGNWKWVDEEYNDQSAGCAAPPSFDLYIRMQQQQQQLIRHYFAESFCSTGVPLGIYNTVRITPRTDKPSFFSMLGKSTIRSDYSGI